MKSRRFTVLSRCIAGACVALVAATSISATRSNKAEIARNLDIFNAIYKELQTNYVDSIDSEKAITTAIDAMLGSLDPYTEYFPASSQDQLTQMTSGEYGGIGALIQEVKGKGVIISEPYENTPSAKAGLRPGDLLMVIDNDTVLGWSSKKVTEKLKGEAGTKLKVTVKRPYAKDSILTLDVTRSKIQLPSVPYYGVIRDEIGYIYLNQFTDKAAENVKNALIELKKDPRVKAIALDLRGNVGGLLEAAVQIVGYFVPKNTEVLRTRGKGVLNEKVYKTTNKPIDTDIPLIVLIDGSSASSSEITAGALQDFDRAVLVGNRSFGKGLVQHTRPLPFDGVLKVTVAKYYIPSGRLIQAIDYSHRNPDGSVARIPDSLTNVFTTANGREVRDGGGITPDIEVEYGDVNRLTYNIVSDNWAFDYATKFASEHPAIPSAEEFVVTDSMFNDFKKFIDPDKFNYDKVCEQMVAALRKAADNEGYMNDSVKAQIDRLEGMLKHNLDHDLDNNRKDIEGLIAGEILKRYYFEKGQVIQSLKSDPGIDSVVVLINDPVRYKAILSPEKKQD